MLLLCGHLAEPTGTVDDALGVEIQYRCRHPLHQTTTVCKCLLCEHYHRHPEPTANDPDAVDDGCRHPAGVVVNRDDQDAGVADLYRGAAGFLILGGPSTTTMPLHLLGQRGCLIMSCNNSPAVLPAPLRPHLWIHTDPPKKFHDSIWRDPAILKFTPTRDWEVGRKNKKALRLRTTDGSIQRYDGVGAKDRPAVLGFRRNTEFAPDRWLCEPTFNRGNDDKNANGKKGRTPNGFPHVINTMFTAIRLAFYLGISPLYLVGADFHMDEDQPYGFSQGKSKGGVRANNHAFSKMDRMFRELLPHFAEAGFEVINCTPKSALWAFPYRDFQEAVADVTAGFEQELNCNGWYDSTED